MFLKAIYGRNIIFAVDYSSEIANANFESKSPSQACRETTTTVGSNESLHKARYMRQNRDHLPAPDRLWVVNYSRPVGDIP